MNYEIPPWAMFAFFSILLFWSDAATTHLAANAHGWQWEANPLWTDVLAKASIFRLLVSAISFGLAAAVLVHAFSRVSPSLGISYGVFWLSVQASVVLSNILSWIIGEPYITRIFWFFPFVSAFIILASLKILCSGAEPAALSLLVGHTIIVIFGFTFPISHFVRLAGPLFLSLMFFYLFSIPTVQNNNSQS
ncbi:MAG: hypothetical protein ABH950_00295 [Candidatus Altiarchaeota archaeon]